MTRKTAEAYGAVFKYIEDNLFKLEPAEFMTDFEDGMRLAIRTHWPDVLIRGCIFHFKRAINRKCISLGLTTLMRDNDEAKKIRAMLGNLALLPASQILEGYASVRSFATQNGLDRRLAGLFAYFESYWLKQVWILSFHSDFS